MVATVDFTAPTFDSIVRIDPFTTNSGVVHYRLEFSEPVTGVDDPANGSLVVSGVTGASITSITPFAGLNGLWWDVAVNTGTGDGTIALSETGQKIYDLAGNPLVGVSYAAPVALPGGLPGLTLDTADFNADGKTDIVTVNYELNSVSIFTGNGDGTFQNKGNIPTFALPTSAAVGDFNGDGFADLAIVYNGSNNVSLMLGDNTGHFVAGPNLRVSTDGLAVAASDLNGDGRTDIVVADLYSGELIVFFNNGSLSFSSTAFDSLVNQPTALELGDFDGNGSPDIAVTSWATNAVVVFSNNGTGGFIPALARPLQGAPDFGHTIATADLNGDGALDLVIANSSANIISVLLGSLSQPFQNSFQNSVSYSAGLYPSSVQIGDVNGDGILDLVVADVNSNAVVALLGLGGGLFAPATLVSSPTTPHDVALADFNNDGKADIVSEGIPGAPLVYLSKATPAISAPSYTIIKTLPVAVITPDTTAPHTNQTINFSGASSSDTNPLDTITQYQWDFGDGSALVTSITPTTTHTYSQSGTYTPTLTVTDSAGNTATTSLQVKPHDDAAQANSTLAASPTSLLSDGSQSTTLTFTARDSAGTPVPGVAVSLSGNGSDNDFTPASGTTDINGEFSASLTSTHVQAETVTATFGSLPKPPTCCSFLPRSMWRASSATRPRWIRTTSSSRIPRRTS